MEKRYSYLWNFFVVSDAENGKAICYLCNKTFSYKTTITNLKKHLENKHPEIQIDSSSVIIHQDVAELLSKSAETLDVSDNAHILSKLQSPKKRKKLIDHDSSIVKLKKVEHEDPLPRKLNNYSKKSIDTSLLNLFIKDFQSLAMVEDVGFRTFVKALNPQYELPSLKTLSKVLLPELCDRIKQRVEDALQDGLSITLTVDSWTSAHHEQLISIKANFLDHNFEIMSVLLDCYSFSEQPTNEKLNDVLKNVINKWKIGNKISLIVSNTSYEQTSNDQLQWDYMNCVMHTISIIAASSLELISSLLLKVQCIVSCYKQNQIASFELERTQENVGNIPLELILSNTTDWYSVFSMLRRFVEVEDFIKTTLSHLDISLSFLTTEEWQICREVVEVIKPFEVFIKSLSEESYITSSLAIILAKGLETMLRDLSQRDFHAVTQSVLSKCLEETVGQFNFLYTSNVLLISTFLDPRFKDVIFEPNIQEQLKQSIINIVSTNICIIKETSAKKLESSSSSDEPLSIWKAFQSKASEQRPTAKKDSRGSLEIQQYLDDGLLPRDENPMQWWKINSIMYPHLANLMKQNLAVTCSAVSSEFYFSKSAQQLHERRSYLSVEEAKLILFLNSNYSLLTIND